MQNIGFVYELVFRMSDLFKAEIEMIQSDIESYEPTDFSAVEAELVNGAARLNGIEAAAEAKDAQDAKDAKDAVSGNSGACVVFTQAIAKAVRDGYGAGAPAVRAAKKGRSGGYVDGNPPMVWKRARRKKYDRCGSNRKGLWHN